MERTRGFVRSLGLPSRDAHELASSHKRFPDRGTVRNANPRRAIETAREYGATIQRISQGSGIMLLTDEEILEMARLGRKEAMEVGLLMGPRAPRDIGSQCLTAASS